MEKEAVEDELDMYGGPSDNQLSNAALELVALAGMELPKANGNQHYFTPATFTMAILASERLFSDDFYITHQNPDPVEPKSIVCNKF